MTTPSNLSYTPKREQRPARKITSGQRFGRLVVKSLISQKGEDPRWQLDCDCGRQHSALARLLNYGSVRSCGCLHAQEAYERAARSRPVIEQPSDTSVRLIPLTKGQVAIVDAEDYEKINRQNWFAQWSPETKTFYAKRNGKRPGGGQYPIQMGREILGLDKDDPREAEHAFHDTLDNRKIVDGHVNLRIASVSQNQMNKGRQKSNRSGFKGVGAKGKGFIARITVNGVTHFLGSRPTAHESHLLYVAGLEKYHGEFGNAG